MSCSRFYDIHTRHLCKMTGCITLTQKKNVTEECIFQKIAISVSEPTVLKLFHRIWLKKKMHHKGYRTEH